MQTQTQAPRQPEASLTPQQQRRKEIKRHKKLHKNFKKYNAPAHLDQRVETVELFVRSGRGAIGGINNREVKVILSPRMLSPEVVLMVNYRMVPGVHFKATGRDRGRN